MIERSRTLFVGFIAFVLVLVTFSSFQKNKQTEGFGSVTCENKLKRFVFKYNVCQFPLRSDHPNSPNFRQCVEKTR